MTVVMPAYLISELKTDYTDVEAQPFDQDAWMRVEPRVDGHAALAAYLGLRQMNLRLCRSLTPEQRAKKPPVEQPMATRRTTHGSRARIDRDVARRTGIDGELVALEGSGGENVVDEIAHGD